MSGGNCGQISDDSWISGGLKKWNLRVPSCSQIQNVSCPGLKVEGDLFVDFNSRVERREYLDAKLRCPRKAGLAVCLLAAFRREPCDVDGFNAVRG